MNPEEAIEKLAHHEQTSIMPAATRLALRLGIESLERQITIRNKPYTQVSIDDVWKPLPSETE